MSRLDLAVFHQERVPLPAHATEDGVSIEPQVKGLGELARRVAEKPDLNIVVREQLGTSLKVDAGRIVMSLPLMTS